MSNQYPPSNPYSGTHTPILPNDAANQQADNNNQANDPYAPGTHFFHTDFLPMSPPSPQDPSHALGNPHLVVIEEEKRRRNTAASARFRVKKKEREHALEKQANEMGEKVAVLESRLGQLEMENKWLRGLITEKSRKMLVAGQGGSGGSGGPGGGGGAGGTGGKGKAKKENWRSPSKRTDGVGTK